MSEPFDAYRKWLGIQPKDRPRGDQPPNHYRLLALEVFEEDPDTISNAADRQMAHVRTFQAGQHSALSQKLLNELSAARVCLLNREKKAAYDAALKRELAAQGAAAAPTHDPNGMNAVLQRQAAAMAQAAPPQGAAPSFVAAPRPLPMAAVLPVPSPQAAAVMFDESPREPAGAPYVTRYSARRRSAGWQVPAAVVATLALLAGAAYVVVEMNRKLVDEPSPTKDPKVVAQKDADKSKEKGHDKKPPNSHQKNDDLTKPDQASPNRSSPDKTKVPPPDEKSPPRVGSGGPIDLLKLIDPKRDAVEGQWKMVDGRLVTPVAAFARLQIPCDVPDEYTLTAVVECPSQREAFGIGLVVGGAQAVVAIDGWGASKSGLQWLDHRLADANETTYRGRVLLDNRPNTIVCSVRKAGIRVTCNGLSLIDWKGDSQRFSLDGPEWSVPNRRQLFIGSYQTSYQLSKLELTPLAPEKLPSSVASTQSPPLLPGQVDLLGRIDLKRDAVEGDWKRDANGVVSPRGLARLRIPDEVPEEYVVTVEVERLTGDEAFGVGLAAGKWWTVAWLDGRKPYPTGLHGIDRTAKNISRLRPNAPLTAGYCVRSSGVVVLEPASGTSWRGLIEWKGDFGTWNWPLSWSAPEKGHLELISSESSFRIRRCVLTPVKDWKPDDATVARIARGVAPRDEKGKTAAVNPRAPLGQLLTQDEKKQPLPTGEALAAARRAAEEKLANDLQAAKTPEQKLSVARKSQRAAMEVKTRGAEQFALLDQARDLAAKAGSSKVGFEAIDELAKGYEIEELELRLSTLDEAAKAGHSPAAKKEHVDSARALIEACAAADRFTEATRAIGLAQAAARVLKEPSLTKDLAEERKDLEKLQKAFNAIADDLNRLKTEANDPAANLAVGKFYCLSKEDWERGLPHLAAGGEATLADLARRELTKPSGADEEKALADAWWDLSRKEKTTVKTALTRRAGFWYRRVVAFLSGIEKETVEKRLMEVPGDSKIEQTQFLSELTHTNVEVVNDWFAKGKNALTNKPLKVGGKESPHGLFTHPDSNSAASISYDLGGKAKRLAFDVAVDDGTGANPRTPLVFQVWADGRLLWQSVPIAAKNQLDGLEIRVPNVKFLELRVNCAGRNSSAHAVWLEPRVTWK